MQRFILLIVAVIWPSWSLAQVPAAYDHGIHRYWSPSGTEQSAGPAVTSGGAIEQRVDLPLPTARLTPGLAVRYAPSTRGDRHFGVGFSIELPTISFDPTRGVPRYDGSDVLVGPEGRLVRVHPPTLPVGAPDQFEIERDVHNTGRRYQYDSSSDTWTSTGRDGIKMVFTPIVYGSDGSSWFTFEWGIAEMVDPHGNYVTYTYSTNGQFESMSYGGNHVTGDPAEYKVSTSWAFRNCDSISARSGLAVEYVRHLTFLEVTERGLPLHRWQFDYYSDCPDRLHRITEHGWGTDPGAPMESRVIREFGWQAPSDSIGVQHVTGLPDMDNLLMFSESISVDGVNYSALRLSRDVWIPAHGNADPLPDLLSTPGVFRGQQVDYPIQPGTEHEFSTSRLTHAATPLFINLRELDGNSFEYRESHLTRLVDLNGDGVDDLIRAIDHDNDAVTPHQWEVYWGEEAGLASAPTPLPNPLLQHDHPGEVLFPPPGGNPSSHQAVDFVDMNGDGALDILESDLDLDADNKTDPFIVVHLYHRPTNTWSSSEPIHAPWCDSGHFGSGGELLDTFGFAQQCYSRKAVWNKTETEGNTYELMSFRDMNGDGNADAVVVAGGTWRRPMTTTAPWLVYLGTGSGWEASPTPWFGIPGGLSLSLQWRGECGGASTSECWHASRGTFDLNGDGLPDVMDMVSGERNVELNGDESGPGVWYRNTGSGFVVESLPENAPRGWDRGEQVTTGKTLKRLNGVLGDYPMPVDADPFLWIGCDEKSADCTWSHPAGGGTLETESSSALSPPPPMDWQASYTYAQAGDWNGDGATDFLNVLDGEYWQLGIEGGGPSQALPGSFLLVEVDTPAAELTVEWRSASECFPSGRWGSGTFAGIDAEHSSTRKMPVVDRVEHFDVPSRKYWSIDYDFFNAAQDFEEHRFLAFGTTRLEHSSGRYEEVDRSADPDTVGLATRIEAGSIGLGAVQTTTRRYKVWDPSPSFGPLGDTVAAVMDYEWRDTCGTTATTNSTCRSLEAGFQYDIDGNLVRAGIINDLSDTSDNVIVEKGWTSRGTNGLTKPCWSKVKEENSFGALVTLVEARSFYDGLPLCTAGPGLLTEEELVETGAGRPTRVLTTGRTYHPDGRLQTAITPLGHVSSFSYDPDNVWIEDVINPLGHKTSWNKTPFGHVLKESEPWGAEYRTSYDGFHRSAERWQLLPSGLLAPVEKTTWVDGPNPSVRRTSVGSEVIEYLNGSGLPIQVRDSLGPGSWSVTDREYDMYERPMRDGLARHGVNGAREVRDWGVHCSGSPSRCTTYTYDPLGREQKVVDPFGYVTYDESGRPDRTVVVDPEGHREHTWFNSRGAVEKRWASKGSGHLTPATYEYDALGRMTRAVDPDGVATDLEWSASGNLLKVSSPTLGSREFWYDDDGNLVLQQDSAGAVRSYVVDALGRTEEVWEGPVGTGTLLEVHEWDTSADGRLHRVDDQAGAKQYLYDGIGRLAAETRTFLDGSTATRALSYDQLDRKTLERMPDGSVATYHYAYGRLDEIRLWVAATGVTHSVAQVSYGTDGTVDGWVGTVATPSGPRTLDVIVGREIDGTISGVSWDFNGTERSVGLSRLKNGLVRSRTFSSSGPGAGGVFGLVDTTTFGYDEAGRVTSAAHSGPNPHGQDAAWVLTDAGDVQTSSYNLQNLALTYYSGNHRLWKETDSDTSGIRTWVYDGAGSVTAVHETLGGATTTTTVSRDSLGRPVSVDVGGATEWRRWYGSTGEVAQETVNGTEVARLGAWERVGGPGGSTRSTISIDGLPVVRVLNGADIQVVMTDLKGTPLALVDDQGTPIYERQPALLGDSVATSGIVDHTNSFLGQSRHDALALNGTGARLMYSRLGQFMGVDRALWDQRAPHSLLQPYLMHPYRYAGGHLVRMGDPSGEGPLQIPEARAARKEWITQNVGWWYHYYPGEIMADGLMASFALADDHGENIGNCLKGAGCAPLAQTTPGMALEVGGTLVGGAGDDIARGGKWAYQRFVGKGVSMGSGVASKGADDIATLALRNMSDSGDTVLGHFPGYIDKANARGASYFDIGDAWATLSDSQRWAANTHFLDTVAARGDRVLLSLPKSEIRPGSYLAKEVQYLTSEKGYVWVNQWALKPGG